MLHAPALTAKHAEMKKSVMSLLKAEPRKPLSGRDPANAGMSLLEVKKVKRGKIETPAKDSAADRVLQGVSAETVRTRRFCAFVFSPLLVCWMEGVQHLMHIANPFFKCPELCWGDDYNDLSAKELKSNKKAVTKAAALRLAVQWALNVRPAVDGTVIANLVKFDENFSLAFKFKPGFEQRFVTEGFLLFTDILHVMLWQISHYSAIDLGVTLARHVDPRVVLKTFGEDSESVLEWARSFLFTQLLSPLAVQRLYVTQLQVHQVMHHVIEARDQEVDYLLHDSGSVDKEGRSSLLQTLDNVIALEKTLEGKGGKKKRKGKNNKNCCNSKQAVSAASAALKPALQEPRASDPVRLAYDRRYIYFFCSAQRDLVETGQTVDAGFVCEMADEAFYGKNAMLVCQRLGMHGSYDLRSQHGFVYANYRHVSFEDSIALALEYGKLVMDGKKVRVTFPRCVIEENGYVNCGCELVFTERGSHIMYRDKQGELVRIVPVSEVHPMPLIVPDESAIHVDDVYPPTAISMVEFIEALDMSTEALLHGSSDSSQSEAASGSVRPVPPEVAAASVTCLGAGC